MGLCPSWLLPSSWLRGHCSAPLSPSWHRVCPHPFLDELQGLLVLRDLKQLHGAPILRGKATHLSDYVPHELGVLGEVSPAVAVPSLVHVLGHLVALVEATAMG